MSSFGGWRHSLSIRKNVELCILEEQRATTISSKSRELIWCLIQLYFLNLSINSQMLLWIFSYSSKEIKSQFVLSWPCALMLTCISKFSWMAEVLILRSVKSQFLRSVDFTLLRVKKKKKIFFLFYSRRKIVQKRRILLICEVDICKYAAVLV